ncbi:MAG: LuxR C-terminal-related transcriptional regulator [Actinomycetota bacterium]
MGRDDLFAALLERRDRGVHLLLRGPAGVGKTRLAGEIANATNEFRAVDRLLASETTKAFSLGALAPLGQPTGVAPPDLATVISWYLGRWRSQARVRGSVLLWLDDAQHLDDLSATVIRQGVAAGAVQLVATQRTPELLPPDLNALIIEGLLEVVDVEPLGEADTTELAEAVAGRTLADDDRATIHRLSAGHPLFIRDLALRPEADDLTSIRSLQAVIGDRLGALSPDARAAAELIAAAEPVPAALLRDDRAAVDELRVAGLVRAVDDTDVRLEHPLYSAWLLESLGPLAEGVYATLADRAATVDVAPLRRADWELRAAREPSPEVAEAAVRAAIDRTDHDAADRFVPFTGPAQDLLRAQLLVFTGDFEAGCALLEQVRATDPDHGRRAEAGAMLAQVIGLGLGDHETASAILAEAHSVDLAPRHRRQLLVSSLFLGLFGPPRHEDLELVEPLLDVDDGDPSSYELAALGTAAIIQTLGSPRAARVVQRMRELETKFEPDTQAVNRGRSIEGWFHVYGGDVSTGTTLLVDRFRAVQRQGDLEGMGLLGGTAGLAAALGGRLDLAIDVGAAGLAAAEASDPFGMGELTRLVHAGNLSLAGRSSEVGDMWEQRPPAGLGPSAADIEAAFSARARFLLAGAQGEPIDPKLLFGPLEGLAANDKRGWVAIAGIDLCDASTDPAVLQLVLDAVGGLDAGGVFEMAEHAAAARLDHDLPRLIAAADLIERGGYVSASARAHADVVRHSDPGSHEHHLGVRGVARAVRSWPASPMWWVDDLETVPSARQLEVLALVASGRTAAQVAEVLHLSTRTVENHTYRAYRALGVQGKDEAAAVLRLGE